MADITKTKRALLYVAFGLLLLFEVSVFALKPVLMEAMARQEMTWSGMVQVTAATPAGGASAPREMSAPHESNPPVSLDTPHAFHVRFKRGYDETVRGDILTIENGSYVTRDNSSGIAQTVAVFPLAAVDSVVAVSSEAPRPSAVKRH